jgi:3-oxoacyl-[acyl-carrier-protein] synthase II
LRSEAERDREERAADVRVAVSNSFGFGGHNATIILRRYNGKP